MQSAQLQLGLATSTFCVSLVSSSSLYSIFFSSYKPELLFCKKPVLCMVEPPMKRTGCFVHCNLFRASNGPYSQLFLKVQNI